MIDPKQIPDEVWWALRSYVLEHPYGYDYREALAAALNAWEGAIPTSATDHLLVARPALVLPLPKDAAAIRAMIPSGTTPAQNDPGNAE